MEELSLTVWAWQGHNFVGGKGSLTDWIIQLMTRLFVQQPLALPGSAKKSKKINNRKS